MQEYRAAMLGCGGIANAHARAAEKMEGRVRWVAACDVNADNAQQFSDQYSQGQAQVFTNFKKMFDEVELDVVYICLPPFAHTNEVEVAAQAGLHILIEKPIALDMDTANAMVEAVDKYGVQSQVGFMSRHGQAVETVKSALVSGQAGRPTLMIAWYWCNSVHSAWWRDKSKSGGQIVEQIIHTYDLTRHFLGEPVMVSCFADKLCHDQIADFTSEDTSACNILFDSGAMATVAGSDCALPMQWINRYHLVAEKLTVEFTDANKALLHHTGEKWASETAINSEKDLFLAEATELLDAIEGKTETRAPMSEGARSLQLVLAASHSALRKEPIILGT